MKTNRGIGRWMAWLALLGVPAVSAPAATLTWTGSVSWASGGGGWLDGVTPATWNSATPDSAAFSGAAAGSVPVDAGGVTVDDVAVTAGDYAIDGPGAVALSDSAFFIDGALTTRIAAALSGSTGLVKTGPGTLVFTNANKLYSGSTVISGGAVRIHANTPGVLGATATQAVVLAGGALEGLFGASLIVSNRIIVTEAGGELRNLGNDTQRWSIDGNRIAGTGTLTLAFGSSNTRIQIVTAQNDFRGKWVVDSGGNQNRFADLFTSGAFGGATGADAITLFNAGSLALRAGVTLGSTTQGVQMVGPLQCKITVTGGATGVLAGALSGSATNPVQFFLENSSSLLTLSNAANSWLGETTINGPGVVRLGAAGVLPDTGGNVIINSGSTLDVNGNDEALGGLFGAGRVDNRAAASAATLTFGANNNSPTFSGSIANSGAGAVLSLVKVGSGIQTLSGTNTITGSVTVEDGVLLLSGAGSLSACTSITVQAGATFSVNTRTDGTLTLGATQMLTGDGTVRGNVTNLGVVAPGLEVGTLIVSGQYAQAASGELRVVIAGAASADQLAVRNIAWLGGTLDVTLDGYTPVAGDAFTVLTATSVSNTFASANLPALGAGDGWLLQYATNAVTLVVTGAPPATGYDAWVAQITNGQAGYQDDADQDGYDNLLEYATGGNPTNSDAVANLGGVLTGGVFTVRFNRDTNAVDVTLIVEGSTNLADGAVWSGIATNVAGSWSPAVATETGAGSPVSVSVPDNAAGSIQRYLRLRVTRP